MPSLKTICLNNFITDNVINLKGLFSDCSSLEKLYISHFIITNVLNMENIFDEYLLKKFFCNYLINKSAILNLDITKV